MQTYYNEIICWNGMHILHSLFAILFLLIFLFFTLPLSLLFYDSGIRKCEVNVTVRLNSHFEVFDLTYKFCLCLINIFLHWNGGEWLLCVYVLCFIGTEYLTYCVCSNNYYKSSTFFVLKCYLLAQIVVVLAFILSLIFVDIDFSGMLIYGLIFIVALAFSQTSNDWEIIATSIVNMADYHKYLQLIAALFRVSQCKSSENIKIISWAFSRYCYAHWLRFLPSPKMQRRKLLI